ncbi:fumarylacetoacetate hydrolase family protein [Pararhizobium sp. BT-229]|uniref:fumarylacetoacetate hydrolase family protein n=1 Tax=Pararhizobium sp. BT-229 TaxID=2986923 RepID=UPI0021F72D23|nr:fumarylacetoacetate hydrolase family protein [Pararhizobium sp. BT-229]MCV9961004.1 fumarylacetoacetate hydrolase family protein [Pararhizobium sp. BT-229]
MKLATLKDSTRDGKLVVVSKDLTRCSEVGHIARTLQGALDDWAHVAPRLQRVAIGMETGSQPTMRFHEHDAASPLPRAFFWTGGSGGFSGPRDSLQVADDAFDIAVTAQVAVVTNDLEAQAGSADAKAAVLLVLLASNVSVSGAVAASTFSPVAVTPDELGEGWNTGDLALLVRRNGKALDGAEVGRKEAADGIASVAAVRPLVAGSIVGTGRCKTSSALSAGDTLRIEMNDRTGHSIFGAIEQTVQTRGK